MDIGLQIKILLAIILCGVILIGLGLFFLYRWMQNTMRIQETVHERLSLMADGFQSVSRAMDNISNLIHELEETDSKRRAVTLGMQNVMLQNAEVARQAFDILTNYKPTNYGKENLG